MGTGLLVFGLANVVVFFHAWRLTHFGASVGPRTKSPEKLSAAAKLGLVLTGVRNPRPVTGAPPTFLHQSVFFEGPNGRLAAWYGLPVGPGRGTVALFHGYTSEKSHLTTEAAFFRRLGYAVLLIDFAGGGGSAGTRVMVGYREADDVAAAVRWLEARPGGPGPLVLYNVSMGAVAILRAEAELGVRPAANVLECPFGSLRQTARDRFIALQNGFWGPGLSAECYAAQVTTPTLLLWGTADARVTRAETDAVFRNLRGPKQRYDFVGAGHEPYWHRYPTAWQQQVRGFLLAE